MSNPIHPLRFATRQIRASILLVGMLALPALSWAGDIAGVVIDSNTGSFLRGADVRIAELGRATSTGRSGDFRFANVPGGVYTVSVNFIGYETATQTVQVPESGTVNSRISVGSEVVELEEFRIEGYREGRALAMQQKKTAVNIRDIISADSIGALPDRNVADALVRLPGVAVDMSEGEGRFVSIRGISADLNNVTINGATVSNPGVDGRNGRAMPLDVVGSAQVAQLEVIKSVTPDMDAQGLGGTVEIKTTSAFDKEEGFFNGSFEGGYATEPDDAVYRVEAIWARRFGADKKFGVAVSGSYEWRPFRTDAVDLRWDRDDIQTDFDNDGVMEGVIEDMPFIADMEIVPSSGNRQRIGATTKIEWKPNEDTEFYINGIYNKFSQWFEGIEDTFEGTSLEFRGGEPDFLVNGNADDTEELNPFAISENMVVFPAIDAIQRRSEVENKTQTLVNIAVGGKKRWGNLTIESEFNYSFAQEEDEFENQVQFRGRSRNPAQMVMRPGSLVTGPNAGIDDAPVMDIDGIPLPFFLDPEGDGLRYDPENPRLQLVRRVPGTDTLPIVFDNSGPFPILRAPSTVLNDMSRYAHRRNRVDKSIVEEDTYIPRIDFKWDTDNFFGSGLSGFIKGGFKYFNRNRVIDDDSFRPIFCVEGVDLDECFDKEMIFDDEERFRISGAEVPNLTVPSRNVLGFYDVGLEVSARPAFNESLGGQNAAGAIFPFTVNEVESSENDIEDDYDLTEEIFAVYGMVSIDIGEKLTLTGGVRGEFTDVSITANQWSRFDDFGTGGEGIFDENNVPCDSFALGTDSTFCLETSESMFEYDDVFPNVQFTYRFSEKIQLRGAFTTTTGRPNFEDAAPITRFELEARDVDELRMRARIRNPDLTPYYSYNFDLSLEYFTDWGALFAVAGFHKEVDDPIFTFNLEDDDFSDPEDAFLPTDPNGDGMLSTVADATLVVQDLCDCEVNTTFLSPDATVDRLRLEGVDNADHGRVTGIEVTAQVPFSFLPKPFDGFGIDANASFITSEFDIPRRPTDLKTPFFEQPSQIMNAAFWYQKGRFSGRVAVRYQTESFDEVGDPNDTFSDRFEAEREQWDAQASYRLNDHWSIYFNVSNFTNEREERWFGRNPDLPNTIEQFGSVWRFGVRWNY